MLQTRVDAVVWPDHRQFYLIRSSVDRQSVDIALIDYNAHFTEIEGFVMVGTSMMAAGTQLTIEVHDDAPSLSPDANHIVEGPLGGRGSLEIWSCFGDEPEATVDLPPGSLRMRVSWFNIDLASMHPENGGSYPGAMGPEQIWVQLWHSDDEERAVVRAWPSYW